MLISFQCPNCSADIKHDASLSHSSTVCPKCGTSVRAPAVGIGVGTVVGGFRIDRFLGRGSMGEIYLATQLSMGRQVALKIVPQMATQDEMLVKRFIHEVRMLAKVEHPHLATAFEAGEYQGIHYLAMSYVAGEDLAVRLKRDGPLPEAEAFSIGRQVAEALAYAWSTHEILHNDIKPGNIMYDKTGNVKLMDLGLSKTFCEDTGMSLSGVAFGTPSYMSPEQALGRKDIDFRSDQYALGATLYELMTGRPPISSDTIADLLRAKVREPIRSPREMNPSLTRGCEEFFSVLLARDRDDRYESWEALLADLRLVEQGQTPLRSCPETYGNHPTPKHGVSSTCRVRTINWNQPLSLSKSNGWIYLASALVLLACAAIVFTALRARTKSPAESAGTATLPQRVDSTLASAKPAEIPVRAQPPDEKALQVFYQSFSLDPGSSEEDPQPIAHERILEALSLLQERNEGLEDLQALFKVEDGAVILDLSGNPTLKDITPLSEIPIKELHLRGTGVTDLSALTHSKIEKLDLADTPLADITPLSEMPLKELSLWKCDQIRDFSPLTKNALLEKLRVPENSGEIRVLKGLKNLQFVTDHPDGWTQTAAEFWSSREQPAQP